MVKPETADPLFGGIPLFLYFRRHDCQINTYTVFESLEYSWIISFEQTKGFVLRGDPRELPYMDFPAAAGDPRVYAAPQATFFRLIGQARRYRSGPGRFHSRVSFIAQPVPNFNEQTGLFSPLINVHLFELLFQNGRPR